jgi:Carboxypeptidase regulatory-like domain/TonB dependent receptor
MKNLRFAAWLIFSLALGAGLQVLTASNLYAQTSYGTVSGTVTDASGAAITDAQVTITNMASGEKRVQPTGADGYFSFVNLVPGTYRIDVEKSGFKRVTRPDIVVQVEQTTRIDLAMQVGEVSQTIEVTGETPLLQQETSSLGQVVEGRKVTELPLNGRNVFNLVTLAPSVVPQGSAGGTPVGVNPFGWGNYQVNGSFGNESAEYLDGQPLNIGYINLPVVIPTQDSVEEFKVQTSNTGADWGKFSGGVMNFSTKSGTNDLHGEVYEYLRNRVLNANDPFNKANEIKNGRPNKTPAFTQNQFGLNAGGPVWIPKYYDGRDKTFWFFSWEAFRLRQGASPVLTTVPTPAELGGDFSSPGIATIMDPCGGTVTSGACPNYTGPPTPFPGNMIPASRLNPTSQALEKLWPGANSPCTPDSIIGCKNNYAKSYATGGNQNQVVGRLDQTLSANQRIFFRYTYWNVLDLPQDPLGTGLCQDRCAEKYNTTAVALGYNWNVTPNTIAAVNASLSRFAYNRSPNNAGFDLTTIGWPSSFNTVIPSIARTPPTPCVLDYADNVMCSQGQSFIQDRNTQYDIGPSLTFVRGHHTTKIGYQLEVGRDNYAQTNVASGSFAFCGSGLPCFTGNGFADFLLGYADNPNNVENHFFGQAVVPALVAGQQIYNAFYVDDTYRVTKKLTLNLGLRYDLQGPWSERFNRLSNFSPTQQSWLSNPSAAGLAGVPGLPGLKGDVYLVSTNVRTAIPRNNKEFAPRVGLAFSPDSKTAIRAGYGVFWIPNYVSFALNPNNDPVNDATTSYTGTINGTVPVNTINTPFPGTGVVPPVGRSLGNLGTQMYATQVVQSFAVADYNDHPDGYVQQWNLNIQRELPGHFFVSAAYVGSKGTHLQSYSQQINQLPDSYLPQAAAQCAAQQAITLTRCVASAPGAPSVTLLQSVPNPFFDTTTNTAYALSGATTTTGQLLRPYPQYTGLQLAGQGSYDSSYNSFQATVERRFASAGSLLVAYTNAKLISDTDTLTNWLEASNGVIQNNNTTKGERSLSSQDVSQRLVISYVLDLPIGRGRKYFSSAEGIMDKVVSGWGIDGVTIFQKGFPLAFSNSIPNYITSFGGGSRPNFVAGCSRGRPSGVDKLNQWFNTACFTAPADFTYGTEGRTDPTLRSSGVNNWDFAVFKRTSFGPDGRFGVAFRAEFFNLFNRTQWAPPNTAVGSSTFGQVSSIYPGTNPRLIQFGLKFLF